MRRLRRGSGSGDQPQTPRLSRRLHLRWQADVAIENSTEIESPCIGICRLDADGYCVGCQRSGEEIALWITLTPAERRHLIDEVLPQREAARR